MATNRIDILDEALIRPGRIDRKIEFPNPTEEGRLDILKIHSRKMNLIRGIDLKKIADTLTGASGAEIKVSGAGGGADGGAGCLHGGGHVCAEGAAHSRDAGGL
jgi:ATP-dependent 26S proteasome regulatory subunit